MIFIKKISYLCPKSVYYKQDNDESLESNFISCKFLINWRTDILLIVFYRKRKKMDKKVQPPVHFDKVKDKRNKKNV